MCHTLPEFHCESAWRPRSWCRHCGRRHSRRGAAGLGHDRGGDVSWHSSRMPVLQVPVSLSFVCLHVFVCVCVCFLSSPLWPALTPTRTHSLQHYTKHSCSLLLSITSIALECTSSFCVSLFFMIIHCDSLKNCEENKRQRMFGKHAVFLVSSRCRKKDKCLLVSVLPPVVPRSP